MRSSVEIHIPISPTESFFRQVHYLAVSLRHRGGRLRDCPIVVTVGDNCEPFDIARKLLWSRHYPIEFRWVPRDLYRRYHYYATAVQRYGYDFRAPYVLLLDADLVVARNVDDLLDRAVADPAVYAVLAYRSPWENSGLLHVRSDEDWWRVAFETAGLGRTSISLRVCRVRCVIRQRLYSPLSSLFQSGGCARSVGHNGRHR